MGTQRLGTLPDTAPWRRVVALIADEAGVAAVAAAVTEAAVAGLDLARGDEGLVYSTLLLARLVRAARQEEFTASVRGLGMHVPDDAGVFDLAAAFTEAVDKHLWKARGRTDLGEMAQLAAVESLTRLLGERSARLHETTPAEVREAARELSTPRGFGALAHDFFARFTQRFLTYHLGRELSLHVGGNGCFVDPDEHNHFVERLATHCAEAAVVMRRLAGDWYSKALSPVGKGLVLPSARGFVNLCLEKLQKELRTRGARDG
jgi:hypothetical protein